MSERAPKRYTDGSMSFEGGVDSGRSPSLLGANQTAFAVNATMRGGFLTTRPGWRQMPFENLSGNFQVASPYLSDSRKAFHVILIGGVTYLYSLEDESWVDLTLGLASLRNANNKLTGWMVQAENFLVVQDGESVPLIFDGSTLRRAKSDEIKVGRTMKYVQGRIWYALEDGISFRATDLVYGDGTRASVLKETENDFLNEGGDFAVPSNSGGITAMAVPGNLDTALGQGPLLVMTPKYIFSIQAPIDRTTWKDLTYPIQAISQISNGALGSRSAITINGDVFYRSVDGIRSFIVARREFGTWGNTPISSEMDRILLYDTPELLQYGSSVLFENRMLMTSNPVYRSTGIIHKSLSVMDFDLISGIRGKLPPAWEGIWTGLDIHQILKTQTDKGDRCFAFARGCSGYVTLWELKSSQLNDIGTDSFHRIQWSFETKAFNAQLPFNLKRLDSGDIYLDQLYEPIDIGVWYRQDQYPSWTYWNGWSECAVTTNCVASSGCLPIANPKPQYRTKMRLPSPTNDCSEALQVPLRDHFELQMRVSITGYCRVKSVRVHSYDVSEPVVGDCRPDGSCTSLLVCDIDPISYVAPNPCDDSGDQTPGTVPVGGGGTPGTDPVGFDGETPGIGVNPGYTTIPDGPPDDGGSDLDPDLDGGGDGDVRPPDGPGPTPGGGGGGGGGSPGEVPDPPANPDPPEGGPGTGLFYLIVQVLNSALCSENYLICTIPGYHVVGQLDTMSNGGTTRVNEVDQNAFYNVGQTTFTQEFLDNCTSGAYTGFADVVISGEGHLCTPQVNPDTGETDCVYPSCADTTATITLAALATAITTQYNAGVTGSINDAFYANLSL